MAFSHGTPNSIVTDGLVFCVDAANKVSWTGPNSSTVNDLIGTPTGSIFNDTSGSYGDNSSFAFDGVSDYIQFTENSGLNFSGDTTISLWVKWVDNASSFIFPIAKQGASTVRQYAFYLRNQPSNKTMTLTTDNGGGGNTQSNSTLTIALNTWTLMTVSIKSGEANQSKFYVNSTSETISNAHTIIGDSDKPLYLGRRGEDTSYMWDGYIGPIQIYNKSLSSSEVTQNYNALKNRFRT